MRKLMVVLFVLALGVTFGSMTASAATSEVTLNLSVPGTVSFGAHGSSVTFSPSSGMATGGTTLLASSLDYGLSGGPVSLTNVISSSPVAFFTESGGSPITFDLNGGALLAGTIDSLTVMETGGLVTTIADLNITSGSICTVHLVCGTDVGQVILNLALPTVSTFLPSQPSTTSATLLGGSATIGSFSSLVTPEPSSILLFGTGLLALGGILRRRRA